MSDNKTIIMNCALTLFCQKGFDATGVQEISDSAGVGKPTIYHYFGNKEGLLKSILDYWMKPFLSSLEVACDYKHDLIQNLNITANLFLSEAEKNRDFWRLLLSMSFSPQDSTQFRNVQPFFDRQFSIILNLFSRAVKDHGNISGREKQIAVSFIGLMNTYISLILNNQIKQNDKIKYSVVHQFAHGIFS